VTPEVSHSRLTRLDVLLIATVALVAFAIGGVAGPRLTREVLGPVEPLALFELQEDVPSRREAVAALDRRQVKLRDRIAVEQVAGAADPSKTGVHGTTIRRLEREAVALVDEQGEARLALAEAEERARWEQSEATGARKREDMLARAIASLAALLVTSAVAVLLAHFARLPIMGVWVVGGGALALVALLAADGIGLVAALALVAIVVIIVVAQGAPHGQLRARRATT
jgi:hypothetical protein